MLDARTSSMTYIARHKQARYAINRIKRCRPTDPVDIENCIGKLLHCLLRSIFFSSYFPKKVSRVGVGGGGQVGQGVQAVEDSGASGQWWRQQHPSYHHHHHHHQHHHHYHHQAGYYTSQSHTHNNPVTTMKQSYMQLTWVFHDDEAQINKKLPKELLLRIFSYLDVVSLCRCAQVSKAWNVLALDGSNWQRIDLFDFQRDVEVNRTFDALLATRASTSLFLFPLIISNEYRARVYHEHLETPRLGSQ
ncbi:hypothetical protein E2986_11564 [Frieseomelitta varia]|uniref:F-box domain-containing protein n=1 Tax=Frieseomelitta varia TaxID=561572 RepID=A0A833SC11_9HYME|nr:hypothetical protein E2986_11564 [Frieseomelitta varia]